MAKIFKGDKFIAAPIVDGATPSFRVARGRIGIYPLDTAPQGDEVDLNGTLAGLKALEKEILGQLVGIDAAVHACVLVLVSGDNIHMLSKPGLAKTTLGNMVGEGVSGRFFRTLMAPDLTRSSIVGPQDPVSLAKGELRRKWAGMAGDNVRICVFDEYGKGSDQTRNLTLDGLEERKVSECDDVHQIDMLAGIASSNEYPEGFCQSAAWDRFTLRIEMDYPARREVWRKLLTAQAGRTPIRTRVDPEEILLLQAIADYRSFAINGKMLDTMLDVRGELMKMRNEVSPRRMIAWRRVAVAEAMLEGGVKADVEMKHLGVGRDILWQEPENKQKVADIVDSASDPHRAIKIAAAADLEEIGKQISTVADLNGCSKLMSSVKKIIKSLADFEDDPEADEISALASATQADIVIKAGEFK
jgi:MoxR-like ATPase